MLVATRGKIISAAFENINMLLYTIWFNGISIFDGYFVPNLIYTYMVFT